MGTRAAIFGERECIIDELTGGRMSLVLFQLPPNFKADVARLDSFLADAATCGLRLAFEFRHSSSRHASQTGGRRPACVPVARPLEYW
jgi:uncharacterized protein YecE (DUF72 family)